MGTVDGVADLRGTGGDCARSPSPVRPLTTLNADATPPSRSLEH